MPACSIVTVEPEIVAMFVFELVYEKAPELLEDGAVSEKVPPFEKLRVGMVKLDMVGEVLTMEKDAFAVAAK